MVNSLRMRLTIWYVGAFTIVLILFSFGVFYLVSRILYERLETNLRSTLRIVSRAVSSYSPTSSVSSSFAQPLDDPGAPNQLVVLLDATGKVLARRPACYAAGRRFESRQATCRCYDVSVPQVPPSLTTATVNSG